MLTWKREATNGQEIKDGQWNHGGITLCLTMETRWNEKDRKRTYWKTPKVKRNRRYPKGTQLVNWHKSSNERARESNVQSRKKHVESLVEKRRISRKRNGKTKVRSQQRAQFRFTETQWGRKKLERIIDSSRKTKRQRHASIGLR